MAPKSNDGYCVPGYVTITTRFEVFNHALAAFWISAAVTVRRFSGSVLLLMRFGSLYKAVSSAKVMAIGTILSRRGRRLRRMMPRTRSRLNDFAPRLFQ